MPYQKNYKLKILLAIVFLAFLLSPIVINAQRPLEVEYPPVPGVPEPPQVAQTPIPVYVRYIFNFSLWITGLIALGALFYAGFRYLTSVGRPAVMQEARDQIFAALLGLLILMASWLILATINPQLIELKIEPAPPVIPALSAGVYLCTTDGDEIGWSWNLIKEIKTMNPGDERNQKIKQVSLYLKEIEDKCWLVHTAGEIIEKLNDKAKTAHIVPAETGALYGALLYDESKFGGKAQVVYILDPEAAAFDVPAIKPSSVRPFVLKQPRPGVYVEVYELIDFNRADPLKQSERHTLSFFASPYIDVSGFSTLGSAKIEGELIVIFFRDFQEGDWPPDAVLDVITKTDANLYDNLMGRWCSQVVFGALEYYPCPAQMVIVSGGIY